MFIKVRRFIVENVYSWYVFIGKQVCLVQNIYIFIDDSGVFSKNASGDYFIYAGYVFFSKKKKELYKRKYRKLVLQIQEELDTYRELKSFGLEKKHKRALFNVMRDVDSLSANVNLPSINAGIMNEKKSIHRYKDYALKRAIKNMMVKSIRNGTIDPNEEINMHICIDEQSTASNGYYDLKESIKEEFCYGVMNFDYGTFHQPILQGGLSLTIEYCDSSNNFLIQSSDILANRIFTSFVTNNSPLRNIPNHCHLHLP